MTQLHEPGEVWHVGWDWYAHMWFVEPPFDVDLDEPIKWFNERHTAFEFVDDWIREQPVQASVVEQAEINHDPEAVREFEVINEEPVSEVPVYVPEPKRVLSDVHIPTPEEAQTERERRLAAYNQRVGIK